MTRPRWIALGVIVVVVAAFVALRLDSAEPQPNVERHGDEPTLRSGGQKRNAPPRQHSEPQVALDDDAKVTQAIPSPPSTTNPLWAARLERQRGTYQKLTAHTVVAKWTGDTPLEERLQALGRDLGITISCDPALPRDVFSKSPEMDFGSASAWTVLTYVGREKGASIRITDDGIRLIPRLPPREPSRVEKYEDDPFGALAAAGNFIVADATFHSRWQSIEECEQTQVEFPSDAHIDGVNALRAALSSSSVPLTLRYPRDFIHTLGSAGAKSGTALAIVQSWLPDAIVIVGRGGLEAWPRQDEGLATRVASDKRAYERFRQLLAKTNWAPSPGDYTWADVAAALASDKSLAVSVLLDPDVTQTPVHVAAPLSFLAILDGPQSRAGPEREIPGGAAAWTWVSGILVLTLERHEL